jgi:hypothetical protein
MPEKTKIVDFINQFDHFRRVPDSGNVIIHPSLRYGFIELTPDFVDDLKEDFSKKFMMASNELRPLSPIERFAVMLLEEAY